MERPACDDVRCAFALVEFDLGLFHPAGGFCAGAGVCVALSAQGGKPNAASEQEFLMRFHL